MPPSKRRPLARPGALIGIRLPASLLESLDVARGGTERSTWIRQVIEDRLITHDLRAIREVVEYAARRGVTGEMLMDAARLLPTAKETP